MNRWAVHVHGTGMYNWVSGLYILRMGSTSPTAPGKPAVPPDVHTTHAKNAMYIEATMGPLSLMGNS